MKSTSDVTSEGLPERSGPYPTDGDVEDERAHWFDDDVMRRQFNPCTVLLIRKMYALLDKARAPRTEQRTEIESPYEAERVREAIDYLDSIGMGNCADAVRDMAARNEAIKATWMDCDCGACKPTRCPVCDDDAVTPCLCREYPPAAEEKQP